MLLDLDRRRLVVEAMLPLVRESDLWPWHFLHASPRLVTPDDLPWMIERLEASDTDQVARAWAELVEHCFDPSSATQVDVVVTASMRNCFLAEVLHDRLVPVELDSEAAEKLRAHHCAMLEMQRKRTREPLDPPPSARINSLLT